MTLSNRITVKQKSATLDSLGQPIDTWVEILETFSKIEPVNGKEFLQGKAEQSQTTHLIKARYTASIKPTHRIYWCDHVFEIVYIISPVRKYQLMDIHVKELFVDA
jgi:SPP1 family predicted phage head-tail adaptor